jgi:ABC-type proline/glycine betaine transport system permease subunit
VIRTALTTETGEFRIPLGSWADTFIDFITDTFGFFFDFVRAVFSGAYDIVDLILATPPFWAIILVAAVLALMVRGWKFAVGTVVGLVLIVGVDQWDNAMDSLALVLVASILAILFSVPLGILSAKSSLASGIIRPVLDFMQTMPAFVYLIPALILFRVGVVPGIVATIIFAMAPGVRLTELGIRSVDREVVEAGEAFGASPWRILRQIQLPLAMPTIMAGINQVIMLSLSMVVIAGMVGAGGLGQQVVASLNRIDVSLGFEAGLSVVILAIFLDRLTAALGNGNTPIGQLLAARKRRRQLATGASVEQTAAPASATAPATDREPARV